MTWKVSSAGGVEAVARATGKRPEEVRRLIEHYTRLHWGKPAHRIIEMDALYPDCAHMGELVGVYLRNGRDEWVGIEFPKGSHLAVHEETERLFLITPEHYQSDTRELYRAKVRNRPDLEVTLARIADAAPGCQNDVRPWPRMSWPNLRALPLGVVTHILYFTDKLGDGPSTYIHEFGEVSGGLPMLAADFEGRLWLAGGNYTTPEEGITN